ncbi:MAG: phosphoribosyl-ATP diphosphatase, partial [Clostridiales Family XIII bacterium]|nr:phosphoribosyl-ATP diphosphatase [Clostridiales Family XIII bacterium]
MGEAAGGAADGSGRPGDVLAELYAVILDRRGAPAQDSYTCYLYDQGLDKILKKCCEECGEAVIAAKSL